MRQRRRASRQIAELVKTAKVCPTGVFLNVNVPPGAPDAIKGLRLAMQSPQNGVERFMEHQRPPSNRRYFWNIYEDPKGGTETDDVGVVEQGYVAVVPLRASEFDREAFEKLGDPPMIRLAALRFEACNAGCLPPIRHSRSYACAMRKIVASSNGRPDELQADGQAVREPARHADRGQAGERRADGEHVRQIHLERIGGALAEAERRRRARRERDDIGRRERALEIAAGSACAPAGPFR